MRTLRTQSNQFVCCRIESFFRVFFFFSGSHCLVCMAHHCVPLYSHHACSMCFQYLWRHSGPYQCAPTCILLLSSRVCCFLVRDSTLRATSRLDCAVFAHLCSRSRVCRAFRLSVLLARSLLYSSVLVCHGPCQSRGGNLFIDAMRNLCLYCSIPSCIINRKAKKRFRIGSTE